MENTSGFGLSVALATPFKSDLSIDFNKALSHANWCLDNGCQRITLLGSTAEAASVSQPERTQLLELFHSAGINADQLVTGIFATDVAAAAGQIREAVRYGSGFVLVAPPYYFKPVDDDGLLLWYKAVFDEVAAELPQCLIYNIPSQTGVSISSSLVSRLRDIYGSKIAGVKDSSGHYESTCGFLKAHSDIAILVGDERQLSDCMKLGAQGSICGMANLHPGLMKNIVDTGLPEPSINQLVDEIFRYPLFPTIKYALSLQHKDSSWASIRPPFAALAPEQQITFKAWYYSVFGSQVLQT